MIDLPPYQQRVVQEKRDLDEKIKALLNYLGCYSFQKLDNGEQSRLRIQLSVMSTYADILGERIAHFNTPSTAEPT